MPYYIRLFSQDDRCVPVLDLRSRQKNGVALEIVAGSDDCWRALVAKTAAGKDICSLERLDRRDKRFRDEIRDFLEDLKTARPTTGAEWVRSYLRKCSTIYSCQFLPLAFEEQFQAVPADLLWQIKTALGLVSSKPMVRDFPTKMDILSFGVSLTT